jgi:hypothetical protein
LEGKGRDYDKRWGKRKRKRKLMIAQDYERGENGGAKRSGSWSQTGVNSSRWSKKPLDLKDGSSRGRQAGGVSMDGGVGMEGGEG